MKATLQCTLVILAIGIVSMSISHPTLAQKEIKLVGVEDGANNQFMTSDIIGDTVIVGAPGLGAAKIFVGEGDDWKEQGVLMAKDHRVIVLDGVERPFFEGFGRAVSVSAPHAKASANIAIIGAPTNLRGAEFIEGGVKGGLNAPGRKGAAYIFTRSGRNWTQRDKLVTPNSNDNDDFGFAVSIDRNTAIVGAPKEDEAGKNAGAAYIFVRDGLEINSPWKQQARLAPQDLGASDEFGTSVFVFGGTAIVGAPKHSPNGLRFAGAAYVFKREGERWIEQAKLTVDDAGRADNFGFSVANSGDTLIVGAPLNDNDAGKDAGAAYVFALDGDRWIQQAKLIAGDTKAADRFGSAVATSGKIAIVGSPFRNEGAAGSGAVYSFVREDGVWNEKVKVKPGDAGQKLNFGSWVALSGDTVIVSAHNAPNDGPESGLGTAGFVYNSVEDFDTPPFAVEPFGLRVTTLGQVKRTALYQNFPNPFNPETWLPYRLAAEAPVTLRIYNVQGQLARELDLGPQKAGGYLTRETAAYWDGRDQVGETVSSGVYFYTLRAGSFQDTRRMLILK